MYKSDQSYTPHHGAFRRQIYHIFLIKHYMYQCKIAQTIMFKNLYSVQKNNQLPNLCYR